MRREKSFTLIELLVVIATIALLASIVLVALKGAREKAQIAKTLQWARSVQAQLGGDMVGSWNFNEGGGTTALDAAGYNNGTLYSGAAVCSNPPTAGCPTWTDGVQGLTGKALYFDGVNDYVDAGNGASLNITDAITIEAWVNTASFGTNEYRGIVGKTSDAIIDGCGYGYGLSSGWSSGNYFGFFIHFEGFSDCGRWVASNAFLTNTWQHLVGTYDSATGIMRIFRNGVLEGTRSEAAGTKIRSAPTKPVIFGRNPQGTYWRFNGTIDEVRIYSRALTAMEIQKHYAEGAEKHKLAEK